MRLGNKVRVYQDPITRQEFEGVATIKSFRSQHKEGQSYCNVEFDEEPGQTFQRWVNESDVIE